MHLPTELQNSVILFVTSNSIERDALISALEDCGAKMKRRAIDLLPRLRVGVLAGYPVCLLSAERGSHGKASVGMLLPDVLQTLKPQLVVLCGFCYSNPAKGDLHDVIVSNKIVSLVDFIAKDGALALRSQPILESLISDEELDTLINSSSYAFAKEIKQRNLSSKFITGNVYSGEIFSEDVGFSNGLFKDDENAVGGDMEGQPVAAQCGQRNIPWMFVKSPSDNGGGTRGTRNAQGYSASVAAIASCKLVQEFINLKKLSVSSELLEAVGNSGSEPTLDLFDETTVHELRGNRSYAAKIGEFVNKCSLGAKYDENFKSHLSAVLKEMAENSVKHGRSSRVQLRGGVLEIALDSDGTLFNPLEEFPKMRASGGGQRELASFIKEYGPSGKSLIELSWQAEQNTQSLVIKFIEETGDLRRSYFCTLLLTQQDLRNYAFELEPLVDLSSCRDVWIDAENVYMSGSDGMLLSNLCDKIPKTVERILIRGVPARLKEELQLHFKFDSRVLFT
ncbi:5'-methylthioadenosine/S-adenosylhomocysteine nucleosidase family protein [Pseudomonas paraglycinae]|uniref:5'-methylthioadenosine/S-adenosylhomocysteine nucleosidase family protein n=1 Tax=Pseudomonas paraglycinae TaxID=2892330 RepID=UPI001F2C062A|nr:hypothetical protein [Pseudomonas paraglycinae]